MFLYVVLKIAKQEKENKQLNYNLFGQLNTIELNGCSSPEINYVKRNKNEPTETFNQFVYASLNRRDTKKERSINNDRQKHIL